MDQQLAYTYGVFPGSAVVKQAVKLNFYQRRVLNYKLECA